MAPNLSMTSRERAISKLHTQAEEFKKRLSITLAEARNKARLSQVELAETTGLAQSFISEIENGHRSPTWDTVFALCDALGLTLAELVIKTQIPEASLNEKQKKVVASLCDLIKEFTNKDKS